jgi:hypothetical protein
MKVLRSILSIKYAVKFIALVAAIQMAVLNVQNVKKKISLKINSFLIRL